MAILDSPIDQKAGSALFAGSASELADELELALRLGQIEIWFQPQFACSDGSVTGGEALARWIHPTYAEIGATELFAAAARAGLADELPRQLLSLAIRQAEDWPPGLTLSLNVTPRQLLHEKFVARLMRELDAARIDPAQVTLEITEEILLDDLDLAARRLEALRKEGIRIALDDFGAGFCNFDYLKRLPIDALKLDRSMVSGVAENERDRAVLQAIATLASVLEFDLVAEGIETELQRDVVAAEGCVGWQGYFGSRPLRRSEFEALAIS